MSNLGAELDERYWEAEEIPPLTVDNHLLDWVNREVCAAIRESWEIEDPNGRLRVKDGKYFISFYGPEMPRKNEDDIGGVFVVALDLMDALVCYVEWEGEDEEDVRKRAAVLHGLADEIAALAVRYESP